MPTNPGVRAPSGDVSGPAVEKTVHPPQEREDDASLPPPFRAGEFEAAPARKPGTKIRQMHPKAAPASCLPSASEAGAPWQQQKEGRATRGENGPEHRQSTRQKH